MKTLTVIFFVLFLSATCMFGMLSKQGNIRPTANEAMSNITQRHYKSDAKTIHASKTFFLACMGRYASYFRSFMPFDEDPCNHMPSHKSFC
jgi:hypothetical protein